MEKIFQTKESLFHVKEGKKQLGLFEESMQSSRSICRKHCGNVETECREENPRIDQEVTVLVQITEHKGLFPNMWSLEIYLGNDA